VFHVKRSLQELVNYLDLAPDDRQWDSLERFRQWLASEALEAGGIGPGEVDRLVHRHIGDSIAYVAAFDDPPIEVIDYGSGAGLPGIPLALVWPNTNVILRDRSGRRSELVERAVQLLGLTNVGVEQGDVEGDHRTHAAIVTRALFPVETWARRLAPRLAIGGQAVTSLGGVGVSDLVPVPPACSLRVHPLPRRVLDHRVVFLIMSRSSTGASG